MLSSVETTSVLPFSEILLLGELQRLNQPLIILVGAQFFDADFTWGNADDWIASNGPEYVADTLQEAVAYFGCGRTFVDDDEA